MRIAIAVHGRFEAFDLARELIRRGNDVKVCTNYPRWAVGRFGVPSSLRRFESHLHTLFGRWASAALREQEWDVIYAFSGIAEEILHSRQLSADLRLLARASAHIRTQDRL